VRSFGLSFITALLCLAVFRIGPVYADEPDTAQAPDYHFTLEPADYKQLATIHQLFLDYGIEKSEAWRTRLESILNTRDLHPDLILAVANAIKTVSGAEAAHKLFQRALRQFQKVKLRLGIIPPLPYQYRHAGLLLAVEQTPEGLSHLTRLSSDPETNDCAGVANALQIGRGAGNPEELHAWIDNYGRSHPECLRVAEQKIADWQARGRLIGSVRNSALDSPLIKAAQKTASIDGATVYDQFLAGLIAYSGQRYQLAIEAFGQMEDPADLVQVYLALSHYRAGDTRAATRILFESPSPIASLRSLESAIIIRNTKPSTAQELLKQHSEAWLKDPMAVIPYAVATRLQQALDEHGQAIEAGKMQLDDPEFHIHGAPRLPSKVETIALHHPSNPVKRSDRKPSKQTNRPPPPGPESTTTTSRPARKTLPNPGTGTYAILVLLGLLFLGTYRMQRKQS